MFDQWLGPAGPGKPMPPSAAWLRAGAVALWVADGRRQWSTDIVGYLEALNQAFAHNHVTPGGGVGNEPELARNIYRTGKTAGSHFVWDGLATTNNYVVPLCAAFPFSWCLASEEHLGLFYAISRDEGDAHAHRLPHMVGLVPASLTVSCLGLEWKRLAQPSAAPVR